MEINDGRKIAAEVRLRQWSEVIKARQASGQSIKDFCKANGINEKQYHYWKRKLREAACRELAMQSRQEIVEIAPVSDENTPPDSNITIRICNAEVQIRGDASPSMVESILKALR